MHRIPASLLLIVIVPFPILRVSPSFANTDGQVEVGIRVETAEIREFHVALCRHYGVADAEIVAIRQRGIQDDELPVLFLIANHAHVSPHALVELRIKGHSWTGISAHFGLGPAIFHVEFAEPPGPPWGKAWGHFRNRPRAEWGSIKLSDLEVVQLANVKFLATYHGCPPDAIVKLHRDKESFAQLHARATKSLPVSRRAKPEKPGGEDRPRSGRKPPPEAGKGGGRGRGKGKGGKR